MHLVDPAKYIASAGLLHESSERIFVISKGSVMPLISSTSSEPRAALVIEVADVPEAKAMSFRAR